MPLDFLLFLATLCPSVLREPFIARVTRRLVAPFQCKLYSEGKNIYEIAVSPQRHRIDMPSTALDGYTA